MHCQTTSPYWLLSFSVSAVQLGPKTSVNIDGRLECFVHKIQYESNIREL